MKIINSCHYKENGFNQIVRNAIPSNIKLEDVVFLCIGTDRSTGDSLGPLIGHNLKKLGYKNVSGTLRDPVHAVNLVEKAAEIQEGKIIIAIDACLGKLDSVGNLIVNEGPMKPGAGVGKDLIPVGDYNIVGVVNVGGFMEYMVLQNTRLDTVINMANSIVEAIQYTFPLERKSNNWRDWLYEKLGRTRKKQAEVDKRDNAVVEEKQMESYYA